MEALRLGVEPPPPLSSQDVNECCKVELCGNDVIYCFEHIFPCSRMPMVLAAYLSDCTVGARGMQ